MQSLEPLLVYACDNIGRKILHMRSLHMTLSGFSLCIVCICIILQITVAVLLKPHKPLAFDQVSLATCCTQGTMSIARVKKLAQQLQEEVKKIPDIEIVARGSSKWATDPRRFAMKKAMKKAMKAMNLFSVFKVFSFVI